MITPDVRDADPSFGPTLEHERRLWSLGYRRVAGLDEVGRGAWAGPVVAAAVWFSPEAANLEVALDGVDDSKKLSPRKRAELLPRILSCAAGVGIGLASERYVDAQGIVEATRLAMMMALSSLAIPPQYLLIDGLYLPPLDVPQFALPKGDGLVLSIAAASVVAKQFRDRLMSERDHYFPGYCFGRHKGYGTRQHHQALSSLGPCALHRLSFGPVLRSLLG